MFSLIKRKKTFRPITRSQFWEQFLSHPQHDWIKEDTVLLRLFKILYESIPETRIQHFHQNQITPVFVFCPGRWAATIQPTAQAKDLIVLFPDLIKILYSAAPLHGVAILAHELGHLYHQHATKEVSMLEAQIESRCICGPMWFR